MLEAGISISVVSARTRTCSDHAQYVCARSAEAIAKQPRCSLVVSDFESAPFKMWRATTVVAVVGTTCLSYG
jgi:hypothetical protein